MLDTIQLHHPIESRAGGTIDRVSVMRRVNLGIIEDMERLGYLIDAELNVQTINQALKFLAVALCDLTAQEARQIDIEDLPRLAEMIRPFFPQASEGDPQNGGQ